MKRERWLLEASQVSALYRTLQNEFPTLGSRPGVDALFGIKTGFDAAFCLDGPTRDSLIADEPSCKSVILKSLRGRHVRRWKPAWQGDWIIIIPSSDDYEWPWSHSKGEHEAEKILHDIYPALHGHLKRFETELRRRQDQGRFWWELRPCAYYDLLKRPKIVVQQILFHSVFALEKEGQLSNAKVYSLTTDELWLLGVLNSRVMWWYMYRSWPHMKDEALAVQKPGLLSLPIPPPPAEMRARIEELVKQAILLADDPSQALLDVEQELNQSVIRAYGLTNADVAVIEQTLPPRDPLVVLEEKLRKKG